MDIIHAIAGRLGHSAKIITPEELKRSISTILDIADDIRAEQKRSQSVTWEQAAKAVLDVKINILHQREKTIDRYKYITRRISILRPDFCEKYLCDITVQDCINMLLAFNTGTQQEFNRRPISCVFKHGLKFGWCQHNPITQIYRVKPQEKIIRTLTPGQIRDLFRACRPATVCETRNLAGRRMGILGAAMDLTSGIAPLALMIFGGIRPFEVRRLNWKDVSFEDNIVSVRQNVSKIGRTRHVTMLPAMRAWLETCESRTGPLCPKGWIYRWAGIRHRAGWDSYANPWPEDSLRHTYASYHAKTYKNFPLLQIEMGHSSSRLLWARYLNMAGVTSQMAEEFWTITPDTL